MREPLEIKKEKLRADLVRANEKVRIWQARARDLERQITECENTQILQAVRSVASSPEELRAVLDMILAANGPSENITGKEPLSL